VRVVFFVVLGCVFSFFGFCSSFVIRNVGL